MAWLERRGTRYRIKFRHAGKTCQVALRTGKDREANSCLVRFEENYRLYERGRLELPSGADLGLFLVSDGKLAVRPVAARVTTLEELLTHYETNHPAGAKEATTTYTERIHFKHLKRHLGNRTPVTSITTQALQSYVEKRSAEKTRRGQPVSHVTVRKELATLSAVWNRWGVPQRLVPAPLSLKGLAYRKGKEKMPFQTREQVLRQIARSSLSDVDAASAWESLFLNRDEIAELLVYVREQTEGWVYPMFMFAAFTGTRRSEMLRSRVDDVDLESGLILIREKKRDRSKEHTFRTVPVATPLREALKAWFAVHPGGEFTFSERAGEPLTGNQASHSFRQVLAGGKWETVPGWHTFRHSFASNLAAKGVDQRIIDSFMGHQTEAMRQRYRHLFPEQRQQAIALVFG